MSEFLGAILVVIAGSALCSCSEAALFSVPIVKVRQFVEEKRKVAKTLLHIREHMGRPIATIVILNNVFNIVGSMIVGKMALDILGEAWLGVFSGVFTLAIVVAAEIIPKTLGERYAETIALLVARPVALITALMTPLVWFIERLVSPITRGRIRPITNEAEIALLAQIGRQEGSIEGDEADLIQRVFRLNDMTARMIMTPRVIVTYAYGHQTLAEAKPLFMHAPHTRVLVVGESIDDVLGIVTKNDVFLELIEGRHERLLKDLVRPVRSVPETARADWLLTFFREQQEHLAVVLDEFGGLAGVVTLEDVLKILTEERVDETKRVKDVQELARQRRRSSSPAHPTPGRTALPPDR